MTAPASTFGADEIRRHKRRLIDPAGQICLPEEVLRCMCGGSELAARECDTAGFFARNLGYIEIGSNDGVAHCRLRPLVATEEAIRATCRWLAGISGKVVVRIWLKGWMQETYPDGAAAAARLIQVQGLATPERPTESFLTQRQPIDCLFRDEHHRFRPLLLRWRIAGGRFDPSLGYWLGQYGLSDRLTIAEITKDRPFGVIRYLGPGITVYGRDFPARAIGLPVEEQPSRDYASWVGQSYADVAQSLTPRAEHVDALIKEPNGELRRSRYERLLLPFSDQQGRRLVFALSQIDPAISVPLYR